MPPGEYNELINKDRTSTVSEINSVHKTEEPFKQTFGMPAAEYEPTLKSKSKKKFFSSSFFGYSILAFVIIAIYSYTLIADYVSVIVYENTASTVIKDIANNSGFNVHGKALFYQASPELVSADTIQSKCPVEDKSTIEYGCYISNEKKIYLLSVTDSEFKSIEYAAAAHEVLHIAYSKLSTTERDSIANKLTAEYNNVNSTTHVELKDEISQYPQDSSVINNELHSFVGSTLPNSGLSQEIQEYYNKYFDNRILSVNNYSAFNAKIESKIIDLNRRSAGLDRQIAEIDNFKNSYLNVNFYHSQSNVNIYNNNVNTYNSKIDAFEKSKNAYNQDVAKFNSIIEAFYPSKTQVKPK